MTRHAIILAALLLSATASHATQPQCADEARAQAHKLLAFHFGEGDLVSIADEVKELAPIRNPANRKQQFAVLEVWGFIYKGEYRMRFLYHRDTGNCTLVGQEILEHASL